jgi:hypothetical protein
VLKLNEFISRLRWGTLDKRRRRGLMRLHDLLAGTDFHGRYWMIMGLLLGCVRDGGPIAWDRDSDFGFMDEDLPKLLGAVTLLRGHGFELRPPQVNNDGRTTKWALRREAVKYEFFLFEKQGDSLRWYYHRRKPSLELVNEVPIHGLTDENLTRIYGDWRRPDPNYLYWRDCGATVDRSAWTGERRPPD